MHAHARARMREIREKSPYYRFSAANYILLCMFYMNKVHLSSKLYFYTLSDHNDIYLTICYVLYN